MKRYKLLKDLPELKAGSTFVEVGTKDMENLKLIYQIDDEGVPRCAYTWIDPEKPNEWFEEISEPTDSIHWKPKRNEKIWYLDKNGDIVFSYFNVNSPHNRKLLEFGKAYRTLGECARARECILAEVRLRRTSTLNPDPKNGNGGYVVYYDHRSNSLCYCSDFFWCNIGMPIRYAGVVDAEKSIKENREDWLIYFGIEEEK